MKILSTRYLKGANVWSSIYKPLLQFTVEMDKVTVEILQLLNKVYAGLEQSRNNFIVFQNDQGHDNNTNEESCLILLSKIGLLLQPENNQLQYFFNFRATVTNNTYLFAFSYRDFETATYVVQILRKIMDSISIGITPDITNELLKIKDIYYSNLLGPSTASIVEAAEDREIPWQRVGNYSRIRLGYGRYQKQFQATIAQTTSCIAVNDAGNKQKTKDLLSAMFIPVPQGSVCKTEEALREIIENLGYPLVIKPLNGNQGRGNNKYH